MSCEHRNSRVADSRPHDAICHNGTRMFRNRPFRFMTMRRRVCEGCGARFNTFEMTEADIAQFQRDNAATARAALALAARMVQVLERLEPEFPTEAE